MEQYSFKQLESDLVRKPSLIQPTFDYIKNLMGPNFKKFTTGKSQTEFANVVVLVMQVSLPQEMAKFLAYHLYPFIVNDPIFVTKRVEKLIRETSGKKVAKGLEAILDSKRKTSFSKKPVVKRSFWKERIQTISSGKKIVGKKVKTIFQSGPRLAQSILRGGTFTSASSPLKREKTILGTNSPLKDGDLENLRVQTLVAFQKSNNLLTWVQIPNQRELLKARSIDFFKILKSISLMTNLTTEQRQFLKSLKSTLMIRANLLLQEEIIVNIINQGVKSYYHTLDRLSHISSNRSINKKIWDYLQVSTERRLKRHQEIFRAQFEKVFTVYDFEILMKKYPLADSSITKKYQELSLIKKLQDIYKSYKLYPNKLPNIINKHLGRYGEANIKEKLAQIFVTNTSDMDIFVKIKGEKTIEACTRKLSELKNNPSHSDTVSKILGLIRSFLSIDNRINFSGFKASLNFVSTPLANKIEVLLRQSLALQLNKEVKEVFRLKNGGLDSLNSLIKILKNPCYQYADVSIFEMNPLSLADKIKNIRGDSHQLKRSIEHAFPWPQFPKSFQRLLEKSKSEQASRGEKNIANFCLALDSIATKVKRREMILIKNEIIDLFTSYGNINFSDVSSQEFLNGYAIARTIREYYNNPTRTQIDLSYKIISEVRDKVKNMIDSERERQLQKL